MSLKIETKPIRSEERLVERLKGEPKVEVLGKMGELMKGKNGGADAKPTSRQS